MVQSHWCRCTLPVALFYMDVRNLLPEQGKYRVIFICFSLLGRSTSWGWERVCLWSGRMIINYSCRNNCNIDLFLNTILSNLKITSTDAMVLVWLILDVVFEDLVIRLLLKLFVDQLHSKDHEFGVLLFIRFTFFKIKF